MEKDVEMPINESSIKPESKPTKKGPGRPKKEKPTIVVPRDGVTDTPHNPNNRMELVYDNPETWKKIFNMFKTMKMDTITWHFGKENLILVAEDAKTEKDRKNSVYITIYGKTQNRYYCEELFSIQMSRSDMEAYLGELTKSYTLISFVSRKLDWQSTFRMLFRYQGAVTNTDQHDIHITVAHTSTNSTLRSIVDQVAEEDGYNISMMLPSQYFKQKISHASSMTDEFKIFKNGDGPLQFKYIATSNKSSKTINFPNSAQIMLESNIHPEDVFSASVYISNIKPFARAAITDYIQLSVDLTRPLIFTAFLDAEPIDEKKKIPKEGTERAVVKVITKIINYKI